MEMISSCRSCNCTNLVPVLCLGNLPLANSLLSKDQIEQSEARYPLNLVFCTNCSLVQITETVPREKLFREYLYLSSFADTALDNAKNLVNKIIVQWQLNQDSMVIEIASNDGYLLKNYIDKNIPVLGIEPALNIAKIAEKKGVPTIAEFFDENLAKDLVDKGKKADVIHANNVLAHVSNLTSVVAGIAHLLKDTGRAVIEIPYVKKLVDNVEFDTIYHEHLCYFTFTSVDQLFKRYGLFVADVEQIQIHGGSLRLYISKISSQRKISEAVKTLLDEEKTSVTRLEYYLDFNEKVKTLRSTLSARLKDYRAQGKRIAAYGASAKGCTLLNFCGIGAETLDFVVDRSVVKQGLYTPGTHLPIFTPEMLLDKMPEYVLLLAWNFKEEILSQQTEYRQKGGKFIIPLPELEVI